MVRKFFVFVASLMLVAASAQGAVTLLEKDGWKAQLGGFAELDFFADSTRSFTESTNNSPIGRGGTYVGDDGRTQMSVGNSRLAFTVLAPVTADGWATKGHIEGDFLAFNGATTERALFTNDPFRIRHAYVSGETSNWLLIAGQTWTLLGWQTYYLQPTVAVPASIGMLYFRTPQLTAIHTLKLGQLSVQSGLSIVRPVQRDSQIPTLDLGLRFSHGGWKASLANSPTGEATIQAPPSVAFTGSVRDFKINAANGTTSGDNHLLGYVGAVDAAFPILPTSDSDPGGSLVLLGEFATGRGYADMLPGYSGNLPAFTATNGSFKVTDTNLDPGFGGINSAGRFELVKLQNYNVTLQYHMPTTWHTWFNLGYAKLSSSNIGGLAPAAGQVTYDSNEFLFANVYHDLTKQVRVAAEYSHAKTTYSDGTHGTNNRYQLSFWYRL